MNIFLRQIDSRRSFELSRSYTTMVYEYFNARRDIYCFDNRNNIYWCPLKILVRLDLPILNKLNRFTQHASECGLNEKWLIQY